MCNLIDLLQQKNHIYFWWHLNVILFFQIILIFPWLYLSKFKNKYLICALNL